MSSPTLPTWLIYCRAGFERDCAEETQAKVIEAVPDSGFVILQGKANLRYAELAFCRQLIQLRGEAVELPEKDRLTPIFSAIPQEETFGTLSLEVPDTNEGKTLSGFTRRFAPLLEGKLRAQGKLTGDISGPRLHIFFPDKSHALIGVSDPANSANALMGILRLKMPHDAPSRSYLKLAEAFEVFLTPKERQVMLKPGMHAVDLGAAPGGWTWYLTKQGVKVTAVDNGPLKGAAAHSSIRHLKQDGFHYRPKKPVDWVVCDMVEKPARVASLMTEWIYAGHARYAIFNLKLPMKKRAETLFEALNGIRAALTGKGVPHRLRVKQLYHDREEVTVFLAHTRASR
jgi:23S rRNA (cytidine2498-2'-O)-methyltransferase